MRIVNYPFAARGSPALRTLPDRLAEVVNVKEYGTTADGMTDDWAALMRAFTWNSVNLVTTATAYSGAVRLASLSWSSSGGGTVTAMTVGNHGLTTGDTIFLKATFSSGGSGDQFNVPGNYNGLFAVTVVNATTFTYVIGTQDPLEAGYLGCFLPAVSTITWSSDLLTVTYLAPHRLDGLVGQSVVLSGTNVDGTYSIASTPTTKQLTLTKSGSGSVTFSAYTSLQPPGTVSVVSVPTSINEPSGHAFGFYLQEVFPATPAASYLHQLASWTSNSITFSGSTPFQADIPAGSTIRLGRADLGTIFLPAGTYYITAPIPLPTGTGINVRGAPGATLKGNFSGFLLAQNTRSPAQGVYSVQGLTFQNDHASGGGLQQVCIGQEVRDCTFKAAVGLRLSGTDYINDVAFSLLVESCIFRPGAGAPSTSIGIVAPMNTGTMRGNYFADLSEAIRTLLFGRTLLGNQFVDCDTAINEGIDPAASPRAMNTDAYCGNVFTNCGTAIDARASSTFTRIEGNYIAGGADAAYGFRGVLGHSVIAGLEIAGSFSQYGMSLSTSGQAQSFGIEAVRSASWSLPTNDASCVVEECNTLIALAYSQLLCKNISTASWSSSGGGTVTIVTDGALGHVLGPGGSIVVSGVMVGGSASNGYNGTFTALSWSGTTLTYAVASDPGTATANTGGVVSANDAAEGRPGVNLTDAQSRAGGTANVGDFVKGGGSQHIEVTWAQGGWKRAA
jgi:hypothetical protein